MSILFKGFARFSRMNQILSHIGNRYIVKNLAYNGAVAKGGSTNFGFQASATTVPAGLTNVILNGKSI